MPELLSHETEGSVAIVRMDDGKANALSLAMIEALNHSLDRAQEKSHAVVLAGREGRMCGGFDLKTMTADVTGMRRLIVAGARLMLRLYTFPRPVVAACTGHALAAGAILLLASDHRVGARGNFRIGLNEVSIQLPLPIFAMELARDRLSKHHLSAATTHARIYDPVTAVEAGYLDEVDERAALIGTAIGHAQRLAQLPADAYKATKERERNATVTLIRNTLEEDVAQLTTPLVP